jgi:hypothetical protein
MRPIKIVAPRPFWTAYRAFHRVMLWWWFGGFAVILTLATFHVNRMWLNLAVSLTVLPFLFGWLGFNGVGILLTTLPQLSHRSEDGAPTQVAHRNAMDWLALAVFIAVGVVFTTAAAAIVLALAWRMMP